MANNNPCKVIAGSATLPVRFSFIHVLEKFQFPDDAAKGNDPKYSVRILIAKDDKATLAKVAAALKALTADPKALQKWGGSAPNKNALAQLLHDGDNDPNSDLDKYPEQAGNFYINAKSTRKVGVRQVVNGSMCAVTDPEDFYPGCYGLASFVLYPYMSNGSKGVAASLENVVKTREGEALAGSGGATAEEDFADALGITVDDSETDDMLTDLMGGE